MLYPFMTLDDDTEIVHSEAYLENGKEIVRVEIEKPVNGGFASATVYLPDYKWEKITGFSQTEIDYFTELIGSLAHVIIQLAQKAAYYHESNRGATQGD